MPTTSRSFLARTTLALAAASTIALPVGAQDDRPGRLPIQLGPLGLAPRIQISLGTDDNVLNDPRDPKSDVVTVLAPEATGALTLSRIRIDGRGSVTTERYQTYGNLTSTNLTGTATVSAALNRISPYVSETIVNSRDRATLEIDTRPHHRQQTTTIGVDLRIASKLTIGATSSRTSNRYDEDALFRGANLQRTLDRDTQAAGVSMRLPISALTTLAVTADRIADRFIALPSRDANGTRIAAGLAFKPTALLTGGFDVGYLAFTPLDRSIEVFGGLVGSADLGYVLLGVTRFAIRVDRHVDYSYDPSSPYYVLTGGALSITQRAGERWSLSASGGRYRLGYIERPFPIVPASPVLVADFADQLTGGVTMILSRRTQLGGTVERMRRLSAIQTRTFNATRARLTLTYQF